MSLNLGAIDGWARIALHFLMQHWQTAVAVLWAAGIIFLLFRAIIAWYREDAVEARYLVASGDRLALYDAMERVREPKKAGRKKYVLTECLFWLPLMAFRLGRKLGYLIFFPILFFLDREREKAMDLAMSGRGTASPFPGAARILAGTVSCSFCGTSVHAPHWCAPKVFCRFCGSALVADRLHSCAPPKCKGCGATLIPDRVHACPARVAERSDDDVSDVDVDDMDGES